MLCAGVALDSLALTLPGMLAAQARALGSSPALIYRDRPISYAELATMASRLAGGLRDLGVCAGDRVAVWLPNTPAWIASLFACARLGAIAIAANTRFRSDEMADILGRSAPKVLLLWPGFRHVDFLSILEDVSSDALQSLTAIVAYGESEEQLLPTRFRGIPVHNFAALIDRTPLEESVAAPGAGCVIFTTSGTTRAPKFVLHHQASITRHAGDIARAFGLDAPDARILLTLPLCGVFGLGNAMGALAAGRPLVMLPTFDAVAAAHAIHRYRVTHFPAAGDVVAQLLATSGKERAFPSVRLVIGARTGQAAPAQARGLTLIGVYGMSEIQAMVSRHSETAPPEQRELGGGVMIAFDGAVRARDPATGAILGHGASGELEFRTPSQMAGYFGDPGATAAVFTSDGFVRSGDLGYTVAGGEFVFQSRMGDALRLSGFLVNPLEIEAVLDSHPAVRASQVVGIDGPRGVRPVAFVIPEAGHAFDEAGLIAHCARRIAKFKVPERALPIDAFPVTPSANGNKIQKAKLREIALAALNR